MNSLVPRSLRFVRALALVTAGAPVAGCTGSSPADASGLDGATCVCNTNFGSMDATPPGYDAGPEMQPPAGQRWCVTTEEMMANHCVVAGPLLPPETA